MSKRNWGIRRYEVRELNPRVARPEDRTSWDKFDTALGSNTEDYDKLLGVHDTFEKARQDAEEALSRPNTFGLLKRRLHSTLRRAVLTSLIPPKIQIWEIKNQDHCTRTWELWTDSTGDVSCVEVA